LEDYYGKLASHGRLDSDDHFPQFRAAVIVVLNKVGSKLPAAPFRLTPNNDEALRKRVSRHNAKRRKVRPGT
jgi:hypothetical protein